MKKPGRRPLLLAFCIPTAIMLAAIIYKGIYPFGDACFLRVDMYNQYMPFFSEFHRKIRAGESLFYSWQAGLGANFTALYAYYLASPFNWLLFFCPENFIIEFMTLLIIIKIGLCGFSFAWYLKCHFHTDRYAIALFGTFYALSGYMAAYNWNIMWLDCIAITPVIIRGLELLIRKRKCVPYCIALGFSILTNYYISIMICIFLVLYLCVLLVPLSRKKRARAIRDFAIYSLLAGGLAGIVWIPGILAIRATRFDQIDFPEEIKLYFNIFQIIARHCVNVATEIQNNHFPNIYCGVAIFLFLPFYFLCRKISWREKLPRLLLLGFFLLSYGVNVLEFLWHGMNYPDSLPARQAFLYIFLLLTICFEALEHLEDISGKKMLLTTGIVLLFLIGSSFFVHNDDFEAGSFLFTVFYLSLYALLLYWYKAHQLGKRLATVLLACLVIMESAMNLIETSVFTTSRSKYMADYQANQSLMECIRRNGAGFYRIEEFGRMTKNDGMLADFQTATLFSSTVNADMVSFYRKMGMSSSKVFYSYEGATPLSSALLSVGDMFSDSLEITDDFHTLVENRNGQYLYRKKYTLPLGYMIPADLEKRWSLNKANPLLVQNDFVNALGIKEKLFEELLTSRMYGKTIIEVKKQGYVYAYLTRCSTKEAAALINGYEKTYPKVYYPYVLDIGWCNQDSAVHVQTSGEKRDEENKLELAAYRLDETVLRRVIHQLEEQSMTISDFKDTHVIGEIEVDEAGILATSIPNEAGWQIRVDGKKAALCPVYENAMLGVELTEGSHTIEFIYRAPGVLAGFLVSLLSALILAVIWRQDKGRTCKQRNRKQ